MTLTALGCAAWRGVPGEFAGGANEEGCECESVCGGQRLGDQPHCGLLAPAINGGDRVVAAERLANSTVLSPTHQPQHGRLAAGRDHGGHSLTALSGHRPPVSQGLPTLPHLYQADHWAGGCSRNSCYWFLRE